MVINETEEKRYMMADGNDGEVTGHKLVDRLNDRAWELRMSNRGDLLALAHEALALAKEQGYEAGVARACRLIAWANFFHGNYAEAESHASQALALYRSLDDPEGEVAVLRVLGMIYRRLGRSEESLKVFTLGLEISRSNGFRQGEIMALNGLGHLDTLAGAYDRALEHHGESMRLARQYGEPEEEANALLGLGNSHEKLGNYKAALNHYRKALKIARAGSHMHLQAYANGNIAIIHQRHGDNATALRYELQSLRCKEEMDDPWGIGISLNNIGLIYRMLGEYASALESHVRSLEITEKIGDRQGESVALNNIALVYEALGDHTRVLDYYLKSLKISEEIGYKQGEAFSLSHIGRFYMTTGDGARGLLYYFKSLRMHDTTGDRHGQTSVLQSIGDAFLALGDQERALEYYQQSLDLARETGDKSGEVLALESMGKFHCQQGDYPAAIGYLKFGLDVIANTGQKNFELPMLEALADTCGRMGDQAGSAAYRGAARECAQQIFNQETTQRVRELIYNFEGNHARRQGELLGLNEKDLSEVNAALRKGMEIRIAADRTAKESSAGKLPVEPAISAGDPPPIFVGDAPPRIEVRTFGEFRVAFGGRELGKGDWKRKRARDLFKLLLINHCRSLTIDEIAEKLWGGASDRNIDLLVMNAVSHIRKALDPERSPHQTGSLLSSCDRTYTLDLGAGADIDFLRFKELIVSARRGATAEERHQHYEAAVALYNGDFLKEDYYEDWATPERDLLKDAFLEALEYLAGEHLRNRRLEQSMELARRILSHDTTSERGYEVLLLALRDRGRGAEARKMFGQCVKIFRTEFGVDPPERLSRIVA